MRSLFNFLSIGLPAMVGAECVGEGEACPAKVSFVQMDQDRLVRQPPEADGRGLSGISFPDATDVKSAMGVGNDPRKVNEENPICFQYRRAPVNNDPVLPEFKGDDGQPKNFVQAGKSCEDICKDNPKCKSFTQCGGFPGSSSDVSSCALSVRTITLGDEAVESDGPPGCITGFQAPCTGRNSKAVCRYDGEQCFDNNQCCRGYCHKATLSTPGTCEDKDNLLYKCRWTDRGVDMIARASNCDKTSNGIDRCPRVGEPAKDVEGLSARRDWPEWEYDGFLECETFIVKCSWAQPGIDIYNKTYNCGSPEGEATCPFTGDEIHWSQRAVLGHQNSWYRLKEKGLLTCNVPEEAYAAWANVKERATILQCGGLPYNCKTKEEAEQECRLKWSSDPAVRGTGKAELCYKYELGETVGRNCRYMWTKDSQAREGCYESAGNWGDARKEMGPKEQKEADNFRKWGFNGPERQDYGCHAEFGITHCMKLPDPFENGGDPKKEPFPLWLESQRGFDAACCEGHMPDPYLFYKERENNRGGGGGPI